MHVLGQSIGVFHSSQTETLAQLPALWSLGLRLALKISRFQRFQAQWSITNLNRNRFGQGLVADGNDIVVLLGQVVEEDCVGDPAIIIGDLGSRNGDLA